MKYKGKREKFKDPVTETIIFLRKTFTHQQEIDILQVIF